jgi:hypothetical protein
MKSVAILAALVGSSSAFVSQVSKMTRLVRFSGHLPIEMAHYIVLSFSSSLFRSPRLA